MENRVIVEFNKEGYLLYSETFPGAYARGASLEEAVSKLPSEIKRYCRWACNQVVEDVESLIVQENYSDLRISDADSEVIFDSERKPLTIDEYNALKKLVIKSAEDFQKLYESIPDKDITSLDERQSFYGPIPRTSREMYNHTNGVTDYYVGQIGAVIENLDNIVENRIKAFQVIEAKQDYLQNQAFDGSYGEEWSLRKVLRRFIWHDRIHAKAMYRMATKIWMKDIIANPFLFD